MLKGFLPGAAAAGWGGCALWPAGGAATGAELPPEPLTQKQKVNWNKHKTDKFLVISGGVLDSCLEKEKFQFQVFIFADRRLHVYRHRGQRQKHVTQPACGLLVLFLLLQPAAENAEVTQRRLFLCHFFEHWSYLLHHPFLVRSCPPLSIFGGLQSKIASFSLHSQIIMQMCTQYTSKWGFFFTPPIRKAYFFNCLQQCM